MGTRSGSAVLICLAHYITLHHPAPARQCYGEPGQPGCKTDHVPDQQRREQTPPYRRIAADLREKIKTMRPGEQIPSTTEITQAYKVSRNTALRALKLLRDEGLITVEQGWGSFVAGPKD